MTRPRLFARVFAIGAAVIGGASIVGMASADDWPQWRGPRRDGTSAETGLLQTWPAGGPRRVWLFRDCGAGYGGPAIVGNRVYINGTRKDREVLLALDAGTGQEAWMAPIGKVYEEDHGDGPRSTPTVDGALIYTLGGRGNLVCVKAANGEVVWSKSLEDDLDGDQPHWGYCESPLVYRNLVICTPGGKKGAVAALDKATGKVVWRSKQATSAAHYASVVVMQHNGHDELVQLLPDQLVGLDPATGDVRWSVPWVRPVAAIPTPLVHQSLAFASSGYGAGCMLVEVGADHRATKTYDNKVMKNKQGGVVLVDGRLYGHSEGVGWVCMELATGKQLWRDRDAMGMGSVILADGRLYCLDEENGDVALVEPSTAGWKERGRFELDPQSDDRADKGRIWTHPVIANGRLYLRDQNLVFCYDIRDGSATTAAR
jgi:outer membrane protein assembly factor BamB